MAKRVEGVTEKLLESAKNEFLSKGYENASLQAIAEKADSSKGAILSLIHISSKITIGASFKMARAMAMR